MKLIYLLRRYIIYIGWAYCSPADREMVLRLYWAGYRINEIARLIDIPERIVKRCIEKRRNVNM